MAGTKQILRVIVKLMALIGLALFGYAFLSGLQVTEPGDKVAAQVELDLADIHPGELKLYPLGRRTLLVLHRTPAMLEAIARQQATQLLAHDSESNQPAGMDRRFRSQQEKYFVAYAMDPFYGCAIEFEDAMFKSVCVNARYDLAGRAYKQSQAQANMIVPDYEIAAGLLRMSGN